MPITPLLGSLLSFSSGPFQLTSILLFPLLTARSTLFANDLRSSIFSSSHPLVLFPREQSLCSGRPYGETPTGFFGRAREKGSRRDRSGVDGAQVYKDLEDGKKGRYKDAGRLSNFCAVAPSLAKSGSQVVGGCVRAALLDEPGRDGKTG